MTTESGDSVGGGSTATTISEDKAVLRGRALLDSPEGEVLLQAVLDLGYDYYHEIPQVQYANQRLLHLRVGSSPHELDELAEIVARVQANGQIWSSRAGLLRSLLETGIGEFSSPLLDRHHECEQ